MSPATVLNVHIVSSPSATVLGKRAARDTDVAMDLSRPLPYPAPEDVVEAMRQRILQVTRPTTWMPC